MKRRVIPVAGCAIIRKGKLLLLFKKDHRHYEFPVLKLEKYPLAENVQKFCERFSEQRG